MDEDYNMYSLEEDESLEMFVTQVATQDSVQNVSQSYEKMDINDGSFLGLDRQDFTSPCTSLVKQNQYSDISEDDEFYDIPLSQGKVRYVICLIINLSSIIMEIIS